MKKNIIIVLVLLVAALLWFLFTRSTEQEVATPEPVAEETALSLGYIIYEPLMMRGEDGELTGVSYDIATAVAQELGQTITWDVESSWPTAIDQMNAGEFDMVGIQMWPDDGRGERALFSLSAMGSPVQAYTQADNDTYNTLADVTGEFVVAAVDTEIVGAIIEADYPEATIYTTENATYDEMFQALADGNADIMFAEPAEINGFIAANPDTLRRISDEPVRVFENSFAFKPADAELNDAWNGVIQAMLNDGRIAEILEKHNATDGYLLGE